MAKKKSKRVEGNTPGAGREVGGTAGSPTLWDRGNTPGHVRSAEFLAGRRAALRELASSGGLTQTQLGAELLYLLPDEFVVFYEQLWHMANRVGDGSVMHGRSGGVEKAKGAQGIVLGSEVGAQAKGGGKRWSRPASSLGSGLAIEVKTAVDKGLQELVVAGRRGLAEKLGAQDTAGLVKAQDAAGPSKAAAARGSTGTNRCRGPRCGKFLKVGWKYCPSCGYGRDWVRGSGELART